MVNRLEPINITSFVGGLNLRRSQFQLADDESPDLLNVDIDPRGGFFTRKGWRRWNQDDIVDTSLEQWRPVSTFVLNQGNGEQNVFVVNNHKVYVASGDAVFSQLGTINCTAVNHQADFAAWGDDVYVAPGMDNIPVRVSPTFAITPLAQTYSEVDAPVYGCFPRCGMVETHGSYMFAARIWDDGDYHWSRLRWSHPLQPDAWRADDFIDIEAGGGRVTAILSFQDHLLIFKTNSLWALYGYDENSWQLVKVSSSVGLPGPMGVTRSEKACYFFSASDRNGMYGYNGDQPVYISEALRPAFEEITGYEQVFVSWAGRRLWVSVPWVHNVGATTDISSVFVMDPDVGQGGAWTMYRSNYGCPGPILDGSDVQARFPLSAFWSTQTAAMVTLDALDIGYDILDKDFVLAATPPADGSNELVTGTGDSILVSAAGGVGRPFDAYYRTRWLHAGWPERKKSWRRPTFICRQVPRDTDLLIETYRDYNETQVARTRTLHLRAVGSSYWTEGGFADHDQGGFDWTEGGKQDPSGRGADWGETQAGATLQRAGSMGLAKAVQMRVRLAPSTPQRRWGVDGIVAKIVMRRFR